MESADRFCKREKFRSGARHAVKREGGGYVGRRRMLQHIPGMQQCLQPFSFRDLLLKQGQGFALDTFRDLFAVFAVLPIFIGFAVNGFDGNDPLRQSIDLGKDAFFFFLIHERSPYEVILTFLTPKVKEVLKTRLIFIKRKTKPHMPPWMTAWARSWYNIIYGTRGI
ncbi:MAG: hypothetical protein IJQ12_10510 [Lachnospiraceae bacterium]|nr:hypothetical protein [Lachnospiraceae bacterium]